MQISIEPEQKATGFWIHFAEQAISNQDVGRGEDRRDMMFPPRDSFVT